MGSYHQLVHPTVDNLSRAIQWLQLTHSMRFNWANQTSGHVFQGRFKAIHVEEESRVAEVARHLVDWTRDAVLYLAVRDAGYGLSEVFGRIPGRKDQAAAQAVKRLEVRRARDPECNAFIRRLARRLSKL